MRGKNLSKLWFALGITLALGVLFLPIAAQAKKISKRMKSGAYSITLKVLPAESFSGPHARMARDGGAEPNKINGPRHPNHHLVAFVRKNGKPVEHATVFISYREVSPVEGSWIPIEVVRMHEAGKSLKTTHYGNNVRLGPGKYEARVIVNASKPAIFHFSLSK